MGSKSRTLVYATGQPVPGRGGSGFEKLYLASKDGRLDTDIVGVVSNHAYGGVRTLAEKYHVPFFHFSKPWDAKTYQQIAKASLADFFALSGWLKLVEGLDPNTRFNSRTVFNIHPSLIPNFCGLGWHGHYVHEGVYAAYRRREITETGLSMHFVTDKFDEGPVFFRCHVKINDDDTPDSIGTKVNAQEHVYQSIITDMVVNGLITWDGVNHDSLQVPFWYEMDQHEVAR